MLPDYLGDQLAPVPALAGAAAVTTALRLGALVFDNDFRHPVVLAKEAATVDVLSGGRLELGLGAGWMNTDYEQSGIAHHPGGVRVSRMAEAVTVLEGLFAEGAFSNAGEHYTISGLDGRPKPVQRPHPPCSSVVAAGGFSRSPPGTPTSSGSTPRPPAAHGTPPQPEAAWRERPTPNSAGSATPPATDMAIWS
jgi:alkanesulfonate monooxygenase SsuD/methylene tetrahydromethanopterin reductase-like flavin-dependent oxidoreductase (luciferase family)